MDTELEFQRLYGEKETAEVAGARKVAAGVCHHTNQLRQVIIGCSELLQLALVEGDTNAIIDCSDKITEATLSMETLFHKLETLAHEGANVLITVGDTNILDIDATVV